MSIQCNKCEKSIEKLAEFISLSAKVDDPADKKFSRLMEKAVKECTSKEGEQTFQSKKLIERIIEPIAVGKLDTRRSHLLTIFLTPLLSDTEHEKLKHLIVRTHINAPVDEKVFELANEKFQELRTTADSKSKIKTVDDVSRTIKNGYPSLSELTLSFQYSLTGIFHTLFPFLSSSPLQSWQNGDKLLNKWIDDKKRHITVEDLVELNNTIRNHPGDIMARGIRTCEVSVGPHRHKSYFKPEYISEELKLCLEWLNEELSSGKANPILVTAKAYQWLISIHPFTDGNGRTTRLLADYILKTNQLPAGNYPSEQQRLAVFHRDTYDACTSSFAAEVIIKSLEE
jgi:Fic/DOC family